MSVRPCTRIEVETQLGATEGGGCVPVTTHTNEVSPFRLCGAEDPVKVV